MLFQEVKEERIKIMDTLTLAIVVLFFIIAIGYFGYLGYKQTTSQSDYLVAGRSTHPFVMAMSYGAAFISTSAIVGFGGVAGLFGMGLMYLPFMNIAIGILIAFLVFGIRTRRMGQYLNARTFPELIGNRFKSNNLKIFCAIIIFLFMPLYSSVVLIGGARFLQEVMKVPYEVALLVFATVVAIYVIFGGLKGVMFIDAFMGCIMLLGLIFLLCMTYHLLGGVVDAHQNLTDMAHLVPKSLQEKGHIGWTSMPRFNSEWWWTLVSSLMLGVGIGALAQPQLAVRFMTVKSTRELNRAVLVGSVFILFTAGTAYMVGALSNVYFYQTLGKISIDAAHGNSDLIIPQFINSAMPKFFVYIFTLTLLSAAMSTLSSLFHVTGSAVGHDFFRNLYNKRADNIWYSRIGICLGIILSVCLAFVLPAGIVARGTAIFFGVCAASFMPTYIAAIYWKRATTAGVWASIASGVVVSLFGLIFLHRKESASLGICQTLFGKSELISEFPWPYIDTIVYALPLSCLVLVVVSLLTTELNQPHITRCFKK